MPLHVIMTAAKTVSRASVDVSPLPDTMSVTMSPTSITVTATARTSDPSGSPTRAATISAWWTAASTAAASTSATRTTTGVGRNRPQVSARRTTPSAGTVAVQFVIQAGRESRCRLTMP